MDRHANMTIPYQNTGIPVYLTCKAGEEPRPAVILIHEVWGLNDHIKSIADRLCQEGFMVLAPDLLAHTKMEEVLDPSLQKIIFDEEEKLKHQTEIRAMWTPLRSPEFAHETINKLRTCFDYLINQKDISKIGVMGFCFGGTYSFNLAINQPELAAAVPFYGHFDHSEDELDLIDMPILAFYGEKDKNLMEHLPELEERMQKAGKDFTFKVYPNCGHAFFNDTNELTYSKEAAEDAWKRALNFLTVHLQ
jgi:carboxymethylenebutenolidase